MAITLKSTKGLHAHGVKCLVYGHAGAGKTSLIPTLPAPIVLSASACRRKSAHRVGSTRLQPSQRAADVRSGVVAEALECLPG